MNASTIAAVAGGSAASALAAYSLLYEQFNIRVREIELAFENLPPAFDGYTILHLSDLHLTKLGLLEKRTMGIISRREVDCCVVTGDVTANPRASDIFRRVCSAIPHRDPIFLVLGNSEHKPWLDTQTIIDALTFDGLTLLINSPAAIRRGDDGITVVGLDDPYSRLDDLDSAFGGVDPEELHTVPDPFGGGCPRGDRPRRRSHSGGTHPRRAGANSRLRHALDAHAPK